MSFSTKHTVLRNRKKYSIRHNKAIELAVIEKAQSEVNKNNAEAAAAYLNSVKDIPEVAARFGSLIMIKLEINGRPQIITSALTTEQLIMLEKNLELMNEPAGTEWA